MANSAGEENAKSGPVIIAAMITPAAAVFPLLPKSLAHFFSELDHD
jgi:hypothetical protein